jgi:hypothetical protein
MVVGSTIFSAGAGVLAVWARRAAENIVMKTRRAILDILSSPTILEICVTFSAFTPDAALPSG